jgi:hypothetical protein
MHNVTNMCYMLYCVTKSLKCVFYVTFCMCTFAENAWSLLLIGCNTDFSSLPFSFSALYLFLSLFFH